MLWSQYLLIFGDILVSISVDICWYLGPNISWYLLIFWSQYQVAGRVCKTFLGVRVRRHFGTLPIFKSNNIRKLDVDLEFLLNFRRKNNNNNLHPNRLTFQDSTWFRIFRKFEVVKERKARTPKEKKINNPVRFINCKIWISSQLKRPLIYWPFVNSTTQIKKKYCTAMC